MCRHAPPDPADWIHPTPATIDTPYASQASRALTVSVWIVFAYVRLHARVVVDVCVPPCARRTIHRLGKRCKEARAHAVCLCEVERVGSHALRTSPSACRRTASSTAATGEGAPQPHEALGGITEPRLRAAHAPTRHLWRAQLLLRGSIFAKQCMLCEGSHNFPRLWDLTLEFDA